MESIQNGTLDSLKIQESGQKEKCTSKGCRTQVNSDVLNPKAVELVELETSCRDPEAVEIQKLSIQKLLNADETVDPETVEKPSNSRSCEAF